MGSMFKLAFALSLTIGTTAAALMSQGNARPQPGPLAVIGEVPAPGVAMQADARFEAAPDGVDPIVTGPVSAAFKQRRERLACNDAAWPKIPAGCFPDSSAE